MDSADSNSSIIIAIDGPAASGKSTVARRVAAALGCVFVNSGAMYRAFTRHVVKQGIDTENVEAVVKLLNETEFSGGERDGVGTVIVDGHEISEEEISSAEVNANVSAIAAIPEVRERLVEAQRRYGQRSNVVMEGRDIGSVVFPETPHKFYIDASPEVRERRRRDQGIVDKIAERDRVDSSRKTAPLKVAKNAVVIDSSTMGIEEVVALVLNHIKGN